MPSFTMKMSSFCLENHYNFSVSKSLLCETVTEDKRMGKEKLKRKRPDIKKTVIKKRIGKNNKKIMIVLLAACCFFAGCKIQKENNIETSDYMTVAEAYVQAIKTADETKLYPYLPCSIADEKLDGNGNQESEEELRERIQQKLEDLQKEYTNLHFWNCSIGRDLDCDREKIVQFYAETYAGKIGCNLVIEQMKEVVINYNWYYGGRYQADFDLLYIAKIDGAWYLLKSDWLEYSI